MRTALCIYICFVLACSTKNGEAGPKGDKGDNGEPGAQGAKGETGAMGICDNSTCPQPMSLDGLQGGTIQGAITVTSSVTTSALEVSTGSGTPRGISIESGGQKTTIGGFYCGTTANVNGNFFGAGSPYDDTEPFSSMPKRRAKKLCEDTCSNAAAHPCMTSEIQTAQMLKGGGGAGGNSAVLMPPNGSGWVLSSNPMDSCLDLFGAGADKGIIFSIATDQGSFSLLSCTDSTHGLYCCL